MSADNKRFWSALPDEVDQPVRELVVEALWWTGEELSARTLVDVVDGHVTMWEADHHLAALEALGVVEAGDPPTDLLQVDRFDVPYRIKEARGGG